MACEELSQRVVALKAKIAELQQEVNESVGPAKHGFAKQVSDAQRELAQEERALADCLKRGA